MAHSAARKKPLQKAPEERPVEPAPAPRREYWLYALLFIATFAVFSQVWHHDYIYYDDPVYIVENPHAHSGLTAENVAWAFTTGYTGNWHPLTWLSLMADFQLFGFNSGAQHLVNVLFHALAALFLFAVLRRMTGAVWRSALVAFLFSLHPLRVESVAWAAERKDVLSAALWFLTIWAYLAYVKRPGWARYLAVAAVFSLGLMAKSMAVTLPIVLLLLDLWPLRRIDLGRKEPVTAFGEALPIRRAVLEKVPLLALSAAAAVVTFLVQRGNHAVMALDLSPFSERLGNAFVTALAYIGDLAWPAKLAVFYRLPAHIPEWKAMAAGLTVLGISILAIRTFRRYPFFAAGWFWYLVTLLPVIGLIQVGFQARADRYTYIPTTGLLIALVWGAAEFVGRNPKMKTAAVAAAVAACVACAAATWRQVGYWQDTISLFRHSLSVTTGNFPGYSMLGDALRDKGLPEDAAASYRGAIAISPMFGPAHYGLSRALFQLGRNDESLEEAAVAANLLPDDAAVQYNLGAALAGAGRFEAAVAALQATVRLKPDYTEARANLGGALASLGRLDEAVEQFKEALRLDPNLPGLRDNLETALELEQQSGAAGRK